MIEVIVGIQVVQLGSLTYGIYSGTCLCTFDRIDEHPVLFANTESAYRPFAGRIIYRHFSISEENAKVFLLIDAVVDTIRSFAFRKDSATFTDLLYPCEIFIYKRSYGQLSLFETFLRR